MASNKFELASEALVMVGSRPISSFSGGGAGEVTASTLYDPIVRELLGLYRWRFSAMQAQLTRLAAAPIARYAAAYQLPGDVLTIHAVTIEDALIAFDRYRDQILCDAEEADVVVLDYGYRADEAHWPEYFNALVRLKLASAFAIPIAEDADKAKVYEGKLVRQLAVAKSLDAQGRTARRMPVGRFRRIHSGRP